MSLKWEELTVSAFSQAVKTTGGVCLVPIGAIEKHGGHLPLGTDCMTVGAIAERAARIEPVVLFPVIPYGQIHEAKHQPGTIALGTDLILKLLREICDEISRNGLKKIAFINGHGGNQHLLSHFAFSMLERKREYVVYVINLRNYQPTKEQLREMGMQTAFDYHGGEVETSMQMALQPDLVNIKQIEPGSGKPRARLKHLEGVYTGMFWYADFPDHYAGDAGCANPELGRKVLSQCAISVAGCLGRIKSDSESARLQNEFFDSLEH